MITLRQRVLESDKLSPRPESVANALDILGCMRVGAAIEVIDYMRVLAKSGSNLVAEVLGMHEFIEWDHYPPDEPRGAQRVPRREGKEPKSRLRVDAIL